MAPEGSEGLICLRCTMQGIKPIPFWCQNPYFFHDTMKPCDIFDTLSPEWQFIIFSWFPVYMHLVFTALEGKNQIQGQPWEKNRTCMMEKKCCIIAARAAMSRIFLSELQVETLSPFYDHDENGNSSPFFSERLVLQPFFFWVKVKPLLNSKVWFDSALTPRPPQAWPLPNPKVPELLDGTQLIYLLWVLLYSLNADLRSFYQYPWPREPFFLSWYSRPWNPVA